MTDKFDFEKFVQGLNDPSVTIDAKQQAITDEVTNVMSELAPRLWAVINREMSKHPHNGARLNAILDCSLYSVGTWVGTFLGKPPTDENKSRMMNFVTLGAENGQQLGNHVAGTARAIGEPKLREDVHVELAKAFDANTKAVNELTEMLRGKL